jgi:hypothetical protein
MMILLIGLPLASERAWIALQALPALLVAIVPTRLLGAIIPTVRLASPSAFELHGPLPPPIFLASKVIQPALEGENISCDG